MIPNGARVEREVPYDFRLQRTVRLALRGRLFDRHLLRKERKEKSEESKDVISNMLEPENIS